MSRLEGRAPLIVAVGLFLGLVAYLVVAQDRGHASAVIDLPGRATEVSIFWPFAVVSGDGFDGSAIDLRSPDFPITHGLGNHPLLMPGMTAVAENRAVEATGGRGLRFFDTRTPGSPRRVGEVATPGGALAVAVQGSLAFVADADYGLTVIDVSDPHHPRKIATCFLYGAVALDVAVDGRFAYVAGGFGGLRVVDISDPEQPREVRHLEVYEALGVAVSGSRVLVAAGDSGLVVVPRSTSSLQEGKKVLPTRGRAVGVKAARNLAVVIEDLHLVEIFAIEEGEIFSDGFEAGDLEAWSDVGPPIGVDCGLITISDLREGGNSQIATVSNGLDVPVEIVRTLYTFPLYHPDATTHVDYFSLTVNSHLAAYWDGTGYPPVDVETQDLSFSRTDAESSTTWFVDLDGTWDEPQFWNGTFEVCITARVVDTQIQCGDICTSETWISTVPTPTRTGTATGTPTVTRTPTWTPTPPPPSPTQTPPEGFR